MLANLRIPNESLIRRAQARKISRPFSLFRLPSVCLVHPSSSLTGTPIRSATFRKKFICK
nr:MAG TPA: hypothetical protein [Caudoviricetes sp.]